MDWGKNDMVLCMYLGKQQYSKNTIILYVRNKIKHGQFTRRNSTEDF